MTVDASFPGKPWQNTLVGSRNKLNALFNDGYFSDLTITFPGKEISYKAHKAILAMSSSVFEGMLFGPMAITGSELELPDDNPEAFKIVLAHCYEVFIEPSDIDEALNVYMLADKYFMEELCKECYSSCYYIIDKINSINLEKVLEFSANFNIDSLEKQCYGRVNDSPEMLLFLSQEWLEKVLESSKLDIFPNSQLVFKDSWQYPVETLQEDSLIQILKSEFCRDYGLKKFAGCVSAKVVNNICWDDFGKRSTRTELCTTPHLYLSFTNFQQANENLSLLDNIKYTARLSIHLQCKVIPADRHGKIPTLPDQVTKRYMPDLFLSDVDDNGIDWVISAICSLKPMDRSFGRIAFPRSKLTISGLKILLKEMAIVFNNVRYPRILICSSKIHSDEHHELNKWIKRNIIQDDDTFIRLYHYDAAIKGWDPIGYQE